MLYISYYVYSSLTFSRHNMNVNSRIVYVFCHWSNIDSRSSLLILVECRVASEFFRKRFWFLRRKSGLINHDYWISASIRKEVKTASYSKGIRTYPSSQPIGIMSRAEVIESSLLVTLLANVSIAF